MKLLYASFSTAALLLPQTLLADGLTFGGGITVTSNYLDEGSSQTANGPAIQPYLELGQGGFHAGVWASNLKDADGNRAALDLSGGYRAALTSGLAYDLAVTQHYFDKTGADTAEITMGLNYPMSDQISVNGEVAYGLSAKTFGETVGVDFGLTDKWTLSANVGSADPASSLNWGAGISYALDEHTSMDLQYEDTASSGPLLAIAADYKFGATGD